MRYPWFDKQQDSLLWADRRWIIYRVDAERYICGSVLYIICFFGGKVKSLKCFKVVSNLKENVVFSLLDIQKM